jgi:hypothetical protein
VPGGAGGAGDDWSVRALPFGQGHDHADPRQHANLTTPNFRVVGYDPLFSPDYGGATPAGYVCGDAKDVPAGRRLAVVESRSDVGFTIADVTDAAHPKWLGELVMRRTHVYDVALMPDGREVVAVTSGLDEPQQGPLATLDSGLAWRSCAGETLPILASSPDLVPRGASVLLVDIGDPSSPTIVDQRPLEGLGHSVFTTLVDGKQYVVASSVATQGTDTFDFYGLVSTPLGPRLDRLSTYVPEAGRLPEIADIGGHSEAWIFKHPATGKLIAYVQSREWIRTVDLTDPTRPTEIGRWTDYVRARMGQTGHLHSIFPLDGLQDGRHYVVIGPEWGSHPEGVPSGIVWVLDDTDPSQLREVAAWTLPHEVEWSGEYMFSTHYFAVVGRTLFVSTYHGGVWAVDLSRLGEGGFQLLPTVGVFLPANVSPHPPARPVRWTPNVEEARPLADGTLVTFDSNSGIYAFRYDESSPMPAPAPWPILPLHS